MEIEVKPLEKQEAAAPLTGGANTASSKRYLGLDALRGIAIIGMVFSGVFPHEEPWPSWMFHAQVGPPNFTYTPEVPGISWVDLVFPFFLFSMGAAFPLALRRKLEQGNLLNIFQGILKRGFLLLFFAIVIRNLNWFGLEAPGWMNKLTSIFVFVSFFLIFMRFPKLKGMKKLGIKILGFSVVITLVVAHESFTGFSFDKSRNDIIIVVLANMAVFGSIIWLLTNKNILLRMGIIAFFAGIWLTHDLEGSWTKSIWEFPSSLNWMYQFAFLKYLCIVLPGSVLGDLLLKYKSDVSGPVNRKKIKTSLGFLCFSFLVINLYGLFTREVVLTLFLNVGLGILGMYRLRKSVTGQEELYKQIFGWGTFFVILGLFFEPIDGGIKKDPSSFSFWFLTSGLAFYTFIFCDILSEKLKGNALWKSIIRSGQNPMVAYVAVAFLVSPVFSLLHVYEIFDGLREINVYLGLVKAIVMTATVIVVTSYVTRRGWLWRT